MVTTIDRNPRVAASYFALRPAVALFPIGTAISLLAVDGRWDVPIAAWIAPILLLRFTRHSGLFTGIAGIVIAATFQVVAYLVEIAAPFTPTAVSMALILGVFFAAPFILDRLFAKRLNPIPRLLLLPASAAALEFVAASVLPVGASIGIRAITQGENLALLQIISLLGPYSIGFLIALGASVANHVWESPNRTNVLRYGGAFAGLLIAVFAFGDVRLAWAGNAAPRATVKIAGIVPQMALRGAAWTHVLMASYPPSSATRAAVASPQMKALYAKVQDQLLASTTAAANAGAKIVFWSETAAPVLDVDKATLLQRISENARDNKVYVNAAIGVPYERNETYLIDPGGKQLWHYRKNHPVPGMEPVAPFRDTPPVVTTSFGRISNVICYDADFPPLNRVKTDIMLLPGWDWPEAAYLHTMRMARLRAIENGYSLIRNDYNGVSAAFDPYGRILGLQNTLAGDSYTFLVDVPTRGVATFYNLIGDLFAWMCLAATFGICAFGLLIKRMA